MTLPHTVVPPRLEPQLEAVLAELDLPGDFSPEVRADAERSAASPDLPETDWTDLPFVTVDPPGSTDLDQAMHLERRRDGYRVRYAIADVSAFVRPGSPVDAEARRRGQTVYAPHRRVPLHPAVLSDGAASLLPGQSRPAFVWVVDLDAAGSPVAVDVRRAMVRSRARHTYAELQAAQDAGAVPDPFVLLPEIGRALVAREQARGGASLQIPDQEVEEVDGVLVLRYRPHSEVEDWNAQISLLTGMVAAELMLEGGVGVLRTMPAPAERAAGRFRRQAAALGAPWQGGQALGDFLRGLDPSDPRQLAVLYESAALFRGAGYTPFDGTAPEQVVQAAVAAAYCHVTAPLRRLVDRFALVVCESLARGAEVPGWVREALPGLPEVMSASDRLAGAVERASVELVEAAVLEPRLGEVFAAVVVDLPERRGDGPAPTGGTVQLEDPAVLARCEGNLELGARVQVRLTTADPATRTTTFSLVPG